MPGTVVCNTHFATCESLAVVGQVLVRVLVGTVLILEGLILDLVLVVGPVLVNISGYCCVQIVHVNGHIALPMADNASTQLQLQPLFFAMCSSATATTDIKDGLASYNTTGFQSVHTLDMKYREISHKLVACSLVPT